MIDFNDAYIERLNRTSNKGKFLKAAIVTESTSPLVKKYWVDHEESITFNGNVYTPLSMSWNKFKVTGNMTVETAEVAISNIGNQVVKYLKELDISGNEVRLQMLHLDLLSVTTGIKEWLFKVIGVNANREAALFTLSRELGQNVLPRRVILPEEQG